MKKISLLIASSFLIFACVQTLSPSEAQAARDPSGWVGAMGGLSVPNADNSSSRPMFGITAGAMLGTEYGLGAYYQTSSKDEDVPTGKSSFNYDLYGVEFTYNFEGSARGVYLGGRIGTSKVTSGSNSSSPTHVGAVAGFNHMLGESLSIGGDLSYISVSSSSSISSFSMLNFLATVKVWF